MEILPDIALSQCGVAPWSALSAKTHLIAISVFGGDVLFALKLAEHFMLRAGQVAAGALRRLLHGAVCRIAHAGGGMTAICLMNRDRLSPILAWQVGLTSPAIVQSPIVAAAHSMSTSTAPRVPPGAATG